MDKKTKRNVVAHQLVGCLVRKSKMKAKQMILELQELVEMYGNKEVTFTAEWGTGTPEMIKPYDKEGNGLQDERFKGVKRFHLH